jgi:uncharacterized protein
MTGNSIALQRSETHMIRRIARLHGVVRVQVFGSRATGLSGPISDIDLLVDLQPGRDLLDLVAFKQDVEEALGYPADVVTPDGLSPYMRDQVLAEARPL